MKIETEELRWLVESLSAFKVYLDDYEGRFITDMSYRFRAGHFALTGKQRTMLLRIYSKLEPRLGVSSKPKSRFRRK